MKNIYLIGGGGHCRSCIDVIEQEGKFNIAGIFDQAANVGKDVLGYKIIGSDSDIKNLIKNDSYFLITVGQIKTPDVRIRIFEQLKKDNAQMAIVISPRAYVSKHAHISEGTIVMHDALVNAGVIIKENCIINTKALLEHDALIDAHSHISTSAVINGDCKVGPGSFVGSNSVLKEGALLEARSLISAGSFYREK